MVAKAAVLDKQVWQYLSEQVTGNLTNRSLDLNDIENLCMIIGSFQASKHMEPQLQSLILRKVESALEAIQR